MTENKKILYDDGIVKVRVDSASENAEEYHLSFSSNPEINFLLDQKEVEEISRTPIRNLYDKLSKINSTSGLSLGICGISYESIGLAITQARVRKLEEFLEANK